ncbi:MAG: hypothetical protein ACR2OI_08705 [Acidimicrobiia bacterium]
MADKDMPVDEEHFESIPWSALVPQTRNQPWLVYVAAGAIVALVAGVVIARSVGAGGTSVPSAPTPALAEAGEGPTEANPPAEADLQSEADLLAEIPPASDGARAAVMRAEWFVTDYFTIDSAGGRTAELAGALGRTPPEWDSEVTTYVEWARAWAAVPEGDGRYRVPVAFRSITATDSGFVRGLVHGVAIRVQVGGEGGTRILALPEPIELPASPDLVALPAPQAIPDEVAATAIESASAWSDEATVIEGIRQGDVWRVTVEASDDTGTAWALVVWVDEN